MNDDEMRGYLRGVQQAAAQIAKSAEAMRANARALRCDDPLRHKKIDAADHYEQAANVALATPYALGVLDERRGDPRPVRGDSELARAPVIDLRVLSPAREREPS